MIGEFFVNVWNGIVANKDAILTFLSSAEFVTLICMIKSYITNKKVVNINNTNLQTTTTNLNNSIANLSAVTDTVQSLTDSTQQISTDVAELKSENASLKEDNRILSSKIDSLLEALSVVYATSIKDSATRATVTNILTNAKHCETDQLQRVKEQLETLKDTIATKVNEVAQEVVSEVEVITHPNEAVSDVNEEIMRY